MIIKIIASIIIISASTKIGFILANNKKQRVEEIKKIISALNILAIEIKYSMTILPDIMAKISGNFKNNIGEIFGYAGRQMVYEHMTAEQGFYNSMEYICPKLNINKTDKEILLELGNSLGETDVENQLKSINIVIEQLKIQEREAKTDTEKSEKLYKSLGVIIGLVITIMII